MKNLIPEYNRMATSEMKAALINIKLNYLGLGRQPPITMKLPAAEMSFAVFSLTPSV